MKKFSVLIALALLAVAGTGYAVTCAYDNVPAATLLVPYFKVSRNGSTGGDIPEGGTDTLCAVTNVSSTGVIVHVTLWNKYSKAVLDFNVPLTGFDVAFWRMKDILNGKLNVNPAIQKAGTDACNTTVGFGATRYVRFTNPDAADRARSVSFYATPAFAGAFRARVWDSLDESADVTSFTNPGPGDVDNPACGVPSDGQYAGDFTGYVTLDIVNYCTNFFPDEANFYLNDAIATVGWSVSGYTPNAIMGDIFYTDPSASGGNISGDTMVALEFDNRLDWLTMRTFYGRYNGFEPVAGAAAPVAFQFRGDGREPLGTRYGFRYLLDAAPPANSLQTWGIVWRSDTYVNPPPPVQGPNNLCDWYAAGNPSGYGLYDLPHRIAAIVYDLDEKINVTQGGPSGGPGQADLYVFLETQRFVISPNVELNPGNFLGGWIDLSFPSLTPQFNQAYVGVQHSGAGLAVSVGHSATLLNNQFLCSPSIYVEPGNQP